jgi:hypothetical protein
MLFLLPYLNVVKEPYIYLYRDEVEIILLQSQLSKITPNRILREYGYDGYFTTNNVAAIYQEWSNHAVNIVEPLTVIDYRNQEIER